MDSGRPIWNISIQKKGYRLSPLETIGQSLVSRVRKIFFEPFASVSDPEIRLVSGLVATLILTTALLGLISISVQLFLNPDFLPTFTPILSGIVFLSVAYICSLRGLYRIAIFIFCLVMGIVCFGLMYYIPEDRYPYVFLSLPICVAAIVLRVRESVYISLGLILTMIGILLIRHTPESLDQYFPGVVFTIVMAALMNTAFRLRNRLEFAREQRLTEDEANFRALTENSHDGILVYQEGLHAFSNKRAAEMLGLTVHEIIGMKPAEILPLELAEPITAFLEKGETEAPLPGQVNLRPRQGGLVYLEIKAQQTLWMGEKAALLFLRDVSDQYIFDEQINYLANHDSLTDLPNRTLFTDRLNQALIRSRRHEKVLALIVLDLDRFKHINDSLGHAVGDLLLKELSVRLFALLRQEDTVARLGGDEFAILFEDIKSATNAGILARKILTVFEGAFLARDHKLFLNASLGVSVFPGDGEDAGTLLQNTDLAMYRAKESGESSFKFYAADMGSRARDRLMLENSLRGALERNEYILAYQPVFSVSRSKIIGAEALIRWSRPDSPLISPDLFIPVLEETGLILDVGRWVMREACTFAAAMNKKSNEPFRIAVNLSSRSFAEPELIASVKTILEETSLTPELLELEITESVLMDDLESAINTMDGLTNMGIRLSVDDFGTGYSSLSYLKRFPIHTLKVDRSFVQDIPQDRDDVAIVQATVALAHGLGLNVIAEGVETQEQLDFLASLGCQEAQGYLLGKPMPPEEFEKLL